nr:hypothetical protein [Comamonas thiooxydans]
MTIETTQYLKLKSAEAQKLGRNGGSIGYLILTDTDRQQLYVSIIANDSGGYFSNEIACFDGIEACMPADHTQPFPAKALIPAFISRSANQPSFCAALLRAEGLTAAVPDKPHLHQVVGDWDDWRLAMLDLPGDPYVPLVKGAQAAEGSDALSDTETQMAAQELPGDNQSGAHHGKRKGKKLHLHKPEGGTDHAHSA